MTNKILKSIALIVLLITMGLVFNFIGYGTTQEIGKVAVQQVNNDSAYYILRSSNTLSILYTIIQVVLNALIAYALYIVWKPKNK